MEEKNEAIKPTPAGGIGIEDFHIPSIFTDDNEFDGVDDYAEEFTDKNGNHVRKEVHKKDGWSSVTIESSGGSTGPIGGPMGGPMGMGGPFGGDIIG